MRTFSKICHTIVERFDRLPIVDIAKPRVGIVGEILVKYLPAANNHMVELLEREGAEAVQPEMLDFFLYSFYNLNFKADNHYASKWTARICNLVISYIEHTRKAGLEALAASSRFEPPKHIEYLGTMAQDIVSLGNQTGRDGSLQQRCSNSSRTALTTSSALSPSAVFQTM